MHTLPAALPLRGALTDARVLRLAKRLFTWIPMKLLIQLALCLSLSVLSRPALCQNPSSDTATEATPKTAPTASSAAQQLYALAQTDLLQLRVLLKNGNSQASVGSGFLIGTSNLVITNYHVVSQIALEPETYYGEFKDTQGKSGSFELIAVDVPHDLALVRVPRQGTGFFNLQDPLASLTQGEHLYSLGNPLDLGFTISEGTYNGLTHRGFSEQIMFTGPVNSGMSGGPNVTASGNVAGVNVAHRRDGELVSFLVPAIYAQKLYFSVTPETQAPTDFKPVISQQLLAYQDIMMNRLLDGPLTIKTLGPYSVPVRESEQVRCWGSSNAKADKAYRTNQINCSMESSVYVSDDLQTGYISMYHQFFSTTELSPLRFANLMGNFFAEGVAGNTQDKTVTTPYCTQEFISNSRYAGRVVLCVDAFHKFDHLYNFSLMTISTDAAQMNLKSRLDLSGVSYENGQKMVLQFLSSLDKEAKE